MLAALAGSALIALSIFLCYGFADRLDWREFWTVVNFAYQAYG